MDRSGRGPPAGDAGGNAHAPVGRARDGEATESSGGRFDPCGARQMMDVVLRERHGPSRDPGRQRSPGERNQFGEFTPGAFDDLVVAPLLPSLVAEAPHRCAQQLPPGRAVFGHFSQR